MRLDHGAIREDGLDEMEMDEGEEEEGEEDGEEGEGMDEEEDESAQDGEEEEEEEEEVAPMEEEDKVVVTSLKARGVKKAQAAVAVVRSAFDEDEATLNPRANAALKKALKKKKKQDFRSAQGAAGFDYDVDVGAAYDFSTDFVEVNPAHEAEAEEDM